MLLNGINTIPRIKAKLGFTWSELAAFTGHPIGTIKRYTADWDGEHHVVYNGKIFTSSRGIRPTKASAVIDATKRLINIMAAKGMLEHEIADRLSMEEDEVEQAINDLFVEKAEWDGAVIIKHDYANYSRLRAPKRKKK